MSDRLRALYDAKYSRRPQGFNSSFPRQFRFLLRWAGLSGKNLRILDLGGGTGEYSMMLQQMGHDVSLFELSPVAIAHASELGVRNVIHGDFLTTPPTGEFDVVFVKGFSLLNTDELSVIDELLGSMRRMLSRNGIVLYWGVTNLTGEWSKSGWFNWPASELGKVFDDMLIFPVFRYQALVPLAVNRAISRSACKRQRLARPNTLVALSRARPEGTAAKG